MHATSSLPVLDIPIKLTLVSHALCPYVQRAAIVAAEKGIALGRVTVDLGAKPDWFLKLSPTGKVPALLVGDAVLFESAAIAEFLDEISPGTMLPDEPVSRAQHRAWIEYASGTLAAIATLYNAPDALPYQAAATAIRRRFQRLEEVVMGPWFAGEHFGLVDAAFGPVFRYLDAFESVASLDLVTDAPALGAWRTALSQRESVRGAVTVGYPAHLLTFLATRPSCLGRLISSQVS